MSSFSTRVLRPLGGLLLCLAVLLLAMGLLTSSQVVGDGIRTGLALCGNVVIPSLFPFMVLSGFVTLSVVSDWIAKPFQGVTRHLFHLPGSLSSVILMSLVGGYPVAAKALGTLLDEGRVTPQQVSRMLCFCVNAGPPFIVTIVGTQLLGSAQAGWILLGSQILSTLLIGFVTARRFPTPAPDAGRHTPMPLALAFVQSVANGVAGMVAICSFVLLFSSVAALLSHQVLPNLVEFLTGICPYPQLDDAFFTALAYGLLEVVNGCNAAVQARPDLAFLLCAFFLSFGGLSIICQVSACILPRKVSLKPFLLSRLAHGFLTGAIAYPLYRFSGCTLACMSGAPLPAQLNANTALVTLCLLGMSALMLLSMERCGNFSRDAQRRRFSKRAVLK